jgi:2-polyprenyl-3-methyl-5-hydroxy-6-metoxy-1,4-benzoquinol methylase
VKILTVIANYGSKNERYLLQLLAAYRAMAHSVDFVVLSNVPKNFGSDVEVIVGLPDPDPWSLPFGYKAVMAARKDDYDLFIYSEDDTLITEDNIDAFLDATKWLRENEIAGFLRYEIGPNGQKYCSTIHGGYFWDPRSIRRRGPYTMAHYTNVHSGGFILTAYQLKKCLDSGGFTKGVRKGRYDMLCTAATDPYTQCGLQKLVPISHIERFLLAHLPNVYLGRIGVRIEDLAPQISKMMEMAEDGREGQTLFETVTGFDTTEFDKQYFEPCRTELIELTAPHVYTVLSLGCGWGKTEAALQEKGKRVTAVPLDELAGASAENRGIETTPPNFETAFERLRSRKFDCIIIHEVLEHLSAPQALLSRSSTLLAPGGQMLISLRHHLNAGYWKRRWRKDPIIKQVEELNRFEEYRYWPLRPAEVWHWLQANSLAVVKKKWIAPVHHSAIASRTMHLLDRWLASHVVLVAEKCH